MWLLWYQIPDFVADKKGVKIAADIAGGTEKTATSVPEYLSITKMASNRTWGTDKEVMVMALGYYLWYSCFSFLGSSLDDAGGRLVIIIISLFD